MAKNETVTLPEIEPVNSIKEMLQNAATEVGDEIAYKYRTGDEVTEVTFRAFREDTLALGEALRELGVSGEHIAICAENSYRWINVYLTVLQSSGVFVPIDKELPDADFLNVLKDSDSTVLFYTHKHAAVLREHMAELGVIRYFISIGDDAEIGKGDRFLTLEGLLARGYALREAGHTDFESEERDHEALAMLVYTSGTTGLAKGVMLTEHNLCAGVYFGMRRCTPGKVGLSVLPYHHTYEAVPGILVAIHHHSTLCINENLRTVAKNLLFYKPDYIYLVPAFVEAFYKKIWATVEREGKGVAFSALLKFSNGLRKIGIDRRKELFGKVLDSFGGNLNMIVCGGAPIRAEMGAFFESIGISIFNGYGITECSPLVSCNLRTLNDCTTVGLPLECCEIRLDDESEDGDGEICVRGDIVMKGYYKRPDLTAEVLEADGWFHTGDYGKITKKGQLVITGRKKNLIVLTNGKNIFPEEIEAYIQRIPYVSEVVVFGIRDHHGLEETLGAEVFLNAEKVAEMKITDPEAALKKDIGRACQPLPAYKHISRIFIRPVEFEKTTTNKIRRSSLLYQQVAVEEAQDAELPPEA